MRRRARGDRRGQRGSVLVSTIAITGILAILVVAGLSVAGSNTASAGNQARGDIALQAADAGVDRYVARLVEDPFYFDYFVDAAEDPRIDPGGGVHPPGSPWTPGVPWTYAPGPPTTWRALQGTGATGATDARFGAAAYSLRITRPQLGSDTVTVTSTARSGSGARPVTRAVQSQIRPGSIADFQIISNLSIAYGASATTNGLVYSNEDVSHAGTANAAVYAQRAACRTGVKPCSSPDHSTTTFRGGVFDATTTPSFSTVMPTPIDFSRFLRDTTRIRDAAQYGGGIYRNDPTVNAWLLQFLADGRVRIHRVTSSDLGRTLTTIACAAPGDTVNLPANGAMYFAQPVIVSEGTIKKDTCSPAVAGPRPSVVNGRVTLATPGNLYIGGDIAVQTSGDDVLGLIAGGEIIVAEYTPANLTFRAATIAQGGLWRTNRASADGIHNTMTYIGSQTTRDGGFATMFTTRNYLYDDSLRRLRPPFYPILEGSWRTIYWREVTPPS